MGKQGRASWYGVRQGFQRGVFQHWEDVIPAVKNYQGAEWKVGAGASRWTAQHVPCSVPAA
jgi:viroplasmin and RNaseH domain-containing protein